MTSWMIGSAPDCDVVVDEQAVSGKHCRLTKRADGFYLEDLQSTNGTFVNGQRLTSARRVSAVDKITIGQKIPFPWPAAVAASTERIVSIGQSSDNDVVINRPTISGHHARILIRGSEMILEDLGSTNGTFVGSTSQRIKSKAVQLDDKIFFGSHQSQVRELLAGGNMKLRDNADAAPKDARAAAALVASRPAAQTPTTTAAPAEPMQWNEYLLPALAGAALLVICVVGVLMISSSVKPETAKSTPESSQQAAEKNKTNSNGAGSTVRVKFRMGKYNPDHVVKRIKVSLQVGAEEQDLEEPVDLDLGGGFLLRLYPVATDVSAATAVAFPQKTSLKPTETTVAAGTKAWFEFSADDEENSEGEFSATPQVLDDFSFAQISTIRFAAVGKTAWVLEGYEIEINGELFASHDSVHWRVKEQRRLDQADLAALLFQQTKLAEELAAAEAYVQQGLGEASDERHLQEKKKESANLAAEIMKLRESIAGPSCSYVEKDFALRRGATPAPSQPYR